MRPQFNITSDTPIVIDKINGCIKIWDDANKEYFVCSKEFWMDVTELIKSTRKAPHIVRITKKNIDKIDKKYL